MIVALVLLALYCQAILGLYGSECPGNNYGTDCSLSCGKCGGNGACYKNTGFCKNDCISGYAGFLCQYKCSDTCGGDGSCSKTNFFCREGCKAGYTGFRCEDKCPDTCGGDGSFDKTTSFCWYGCKTGYKGHLCNLEDPNTPIVNDCSNCLQPCGSYGRCVKGCLTGFYGLYCSMVCACPVGVPCQQTSGSCITQRGNFTPTAAPDVTVTTPSKISYDAVSIKREKDSNTTTVNECTNCLQSCSSNGECVNGCVTGFYGLYCSLVCACPVGVPCQQINGRCITQRGNFTPTAAPDVTVTTPSKSAVQQFDSAYHAALCSPRSEQE